MEGNRIDCAKVVINLHLTKYFFETLSVEVNIYA